MCYNFNVMGWPTKAQQFIEDFITKILLGWLAGCKGLGLAGVVGWGWFEVVCQPLILLHHNVKCQSSGCVGLMFTTPGLFSYCLLLSVCQRERERERFLFCSYLLLWFSYILPYWLFVCLLVLFCFVYLPFYGIQCDGPRYIQFIFDEHFTHITIKVCQLNGAFVCVGEVDVIVNPVDSQTIGGYGVLLENDCFVTALVNGCPVRTREMKWIKWIVATEQTRIWIHQTKKDNE